MNSGRNLNKFNRLFHDTYTWWSHINEYWENRHNELPTPTFNLVNFFYYVKHKSYIAFYFLNFIETKIMVIFLFLTKVQYSSYN